MKKRLSNFETIALGINANNTVIPYNPRRKWLFIGNSNSVGVFVSFGTQVITGAFGFRMTSSQDAIQLRYEDVGDLVTQPVSVWNAGAVGSTFCFGEAWDYDEL